MFEAVLGVVLGLFTSAPGSGGVSALYLYCAPSCPPCEEQKAILQKMEEDAVLPAGISVVPILRTEENSEIFAAEKITDFPTILLKDGSGNEKARFEGVCTAEELMKFFAPEDLPAGRSFIRGTVEEISMTSSCRSSRYPNWNCTILLRPSAPGAQQRVLVIPCRRGEEYPPLPEAGAMIKAEIIPWDEAPEDIRSMGLLDDHGKYDTGWYYSPGFTVSPLPGDKNIP